MMEIDSMDKLSLGADKRLKSRKKIESLFTTGNKLYKFPVRIVYELESTEQKNFHLAVSVPKKLFKKAVDRNLLKRRLREAFRLNQFKLNHQGNLNLMLIYTAKELLDFHQIEKSILVLIDALNELLVDNTSEK